MDRIQIENIQPALTQTEFAQPQDTFSLFVLQSGRGQIVLADGQEVECAAPCAFWAGFGQPARVKLRAGSRGHLVRLSSAQMQAVLPGGQVAGFVQRAIASTMVVLMSDIKDADAARIVLSLIEDAAQGADPMSNEIVRHGVTQVLCMVLKSTVSREQSNSVLPKRVVHEFCRLVDQNLHAHWTVTQYAEEIGVTRDHLYGAVRRTLSKAPLEYIHGRLIDRAKSLLTNSDLTVAEIAYRLGYSDAAYFNRSFKRHAGVAPGRFRRGQQGSTHVADVASSFSAWP